MCRRLKYGNFIDYIHFRYIIHYRCTFLSWLLKHAPQGYYRLSHYMSRRPKHRPLMYSILPPSLPPFPKKILRASSIFLLDVDLSENHRPSTCQVLTSCKTIAHLCARGQPLVGLLPILLLNGGSSSQFIISAIFSAQCLWLIFYFNDFYLSYIVTKSQWD